MYQNLKFKGFYIKAAIKSTIFLYKCIHWFLMAVCISFVTSTAALASDDGLTCDLNFQGPITDTSVKNFIEENAVRGRSGDFELPAWSVLCLDSPGGSYFAGQSLFNFITNNSVGIVTYVPSGAECLSACALVFLSGNTWIGQGATSQWNSRLLHVGAIIGFHAPFVNYDADDLISGADGNKIYDAAVLALSLANKMRLTSRTDGSAFNDFLFSGFINTPPDDFFIISTVADAVLANVELRGLNMAEVITAKSMTFVCDLAVAQYVLKKRSDLLYDGPTGSNLISHIQSERRRFTSENKEIFDGYVPVVGNVYLTNSSQSGELWAVQGYPSLTHRNNGLTCLVEAQSNVDYYSTWSDKQGEFLSIPNFHVHLYDLGRDSNIETLSSRSAVANFKSVNESWLALYTELPFWAAIDPEFSISR